MAFVIRIVGDPIEMSSQPKLFDQIRDVMRHRHSKTSGLPHLPPQFRRPPARKWL